MKRIALVLCVLTAIAAPVAAQTPDTSTRTNRQAQLQRQLRERIATMVRTRLQLTDQQARQLQDTDNKFEPERRQLLQREQRVRRELRQEMIAVRSSSATPASQDKIAGLLDQVLAVQRERFLLVEREQRDLARFLSPVQRAQYMGLQNDLRQRVQAMQQQGGPRRGAQRPAPRRRPAP